MERPGDYNIIQGDQNIYPEIHPNSVSGFVADGSSDFEGSASDVAWDSDGDEDSHRHKRQRQLYSLGRGSDDSEDEPSEESEEDDRGAENSYYLGDESHDALLSLGRKNMQSRAAPDDSESFGARGGRGVKRGPRKPLEPSIEFKDLHSEATLAFIDSDYDRAVVLVKQAIQINPEMFAAHSLLSEIFLAQGDKDRALAALFSGAHTRPKDPNVWLKVAKLILERAGDDRTFALKDALYCYSRVLEIDPADHDTRFKRASIYREQGHNGRAVHEYERILKDLPHNMTALRLLSEAYIDLKEVDKAISRYEESIAYYQSLHLAEPIDFTWSDVNIYVEFFSYLDDFERGVSALKSLARWLSGRKNDTQWDWVMEDDREWDADDFPRRFDMPWFVPGQYPPESYGLGLPLELRIKLGSYRLKMGITYRDEALTHFTWLNPEDDSPGSLLFDYGDLFRDAADTLREVGLHQDALRFYTPLQQTNEYADTGLFMAMAECHVACGNDEEAENCYLTVVEYDENNVEVRAKLAKFYEKMGLIEQALKYVNEAIEVSRQESVSGRKRRIGSRIEQLAREYRSAETGDLTVEGARPDNEFTSPFYEEETSSYNQQGAPYLLSTGRKPEEPEPSRAPGVDHIWYLYSKLLELQPAMRAGEEDATEDWLDIADAILRDFRSNRVFFPSQKNMLFLGYSRAAERKAGRLKGKGILDEIEEMATRLQVLLGTQAPDIDTGPIPTDYHGISFEAWLDVFLEYALIVAGQSQSEEAYDALSAAADASVWHHSRSNTRQIYVCWFTCAIRLKDEETLTNIARWFVKEYQFVTDTYRLFTALSRVCGDPNKSLFHSSPSMKFILRQIKAIDYTLPDDPLKPAPAHRTRASVFQERASLSTKDESGQLIPAQDMDVALLVLYGHILYAGNSFTSALNYFFRAYALDPENPAVLLSIGLSYIYHSLKRQSENRHYLIMQGLSFMQDYRRIRSNSAIPQEWQEVEFNSARVWHMLGLSHLAIEGYHRCLEFNAEIEQERERYNKRVEKQRVDDSSAPDPREEKEVRMEDFTRESAFALQCLYAFSGDTVMAKKVTERWLTI